MSKYAQGEPQIKEVRNAEFISSVVKVEKEKPSTKKKKK
jgi:hypothetical protein